MAITQHPGLLQIPIQQQLSVALESHRSALRLNPQNGDVIFNTAQVLTAIADTIKEPRQQSIEEGSLLEESVELFQRCLDIQEAALRRQMDNYLSTTHQAVSSVVQLEPNSSFTVIKASNEEEEEEEEEEEDWAAIEEPITISTLTDTCVALFDALTALCRAASVRKPSTLQDIEDVHRRARKKLELLPGDVTGETKVNLLVCEAKLKSALLEAAFEIGTIHLRSWDDGLRESFAQLESSANAPALCAYAEALMDLAITADGMSGMSLMRYNRVSKALKLLGNAAQSAEAPDLTNIHALRGDAELLRHKISFQSDLPANLTAPAVRYTLLENAGKFYKGAVTVSKASGEATQVFLVKEAIVACFMYESLTPLVEGGPRSASRSAIAEILQEMLDESLIAQESLECSGLASLMTE